MQAFTAIGRIRPGEPYAGDMGGGFHPIRRDADFLAAREAPIRPLLADRVRSLSPVSHYADLDF